MDNDLRGNGNGHQDSSADLDPAAAMDAVLEQVGENADAIFSEIKSTVEDTVKKYPVQSVLVCLGVGCILGALWSSRR